LTQQTLESDGYRIGKKMSPCAILVQFHGHVPRVQNELAITQNELKTHEKPKTTKRDASQKHRDQELESVLISHISSAVDKPIFTHANLLGRYTIDEWRQVYGHVHKRLSDPTLDRRVNIRFGVITAFLAHWITIASYDLTTKDDWHSAKRILLTLQVHRFVSLDDMDVKFVDDRPYHTIADSLFPQYINPSSGVIWASNLAMYVLWSIPYETHQMQFSISVPSTAWNTAKSDHPSLMQLHVSKIREKSVEIKSPIKKINPRILLESIAYIVFAWCHPTFHSPKMANIQKNCACSWLALICSKVLSAESLRRQLKLFPKLDERSLTDRTVGTYSIRDRKHFVKEMSWIHNDVVRRLEEMFPSEVMLSGLIVLFTGMQPLLHIISEDDRTLNVRLFGRLMTACLITIRQNRQDTRIKPVGKSEKSMKHPQQQQQERKLKKRKRADATKDINFPAKDIIFSDAKDINFPGKDIIFSDAKDINFPAKDINFPAKDTLEQQQLADLKKEELRSDGKQELYSDGKQQKLSDLKKEELRSDAKKDGLADIKKERHKNETTQSAQEKKAKKEAEKEEEEEAHNKEKGHVVAEKEKDGSTQPCIDKLGEPTIKERDANATQSVLLPKECELTKQKEQKEAKEKEPDKDVGDKDKDIFKDCDTMFDMNPAAASASASASRAPDVLLSCDLTDMQLTHEHYMMQQQQLREYNVQSKNYRSVQGFRRGPGRLVR